MRMLLDLHADVSRMLCGRFTDVHNYQFFAADDCIHLAFCLRWVHGGRADLKICLRSCRVWRARGRDGARTPCGACEVKCF